MDECCYKITLKNGKEYIVSTEERNVEVFVYEALTSCKMRAYKLYKEYSINGIKFNTIMINSNEISSVEYHITYN